MRCFPIQSKERVKRANGLLVFYELNPSNSIKSQNREIDRSTSFEPQSVADAGGGRVGSIAPSVS